AGGSQEAASASKEGFEEIPQHRRSRCGKNTSLHPFLPRNGTRLQWLTCAVSSGFRRGAKELFCDIPFGSGCYTRATTQGLRFADLGTPVAPAPWSTTVQAVKTGLRRLSSER